MHPIAIADVLASARVFFCRKKRADGREPTERHTRRVAIRGNGDDYSHRVRPRPPLNQFQAVPDRMAEHGPVGRQRTDGRMSLTSPQHRMTQTRPQARAYRPEMDDAPRWFLAARVDTSAAIRLRYGGLRCGSLRHLSGKEGVIVATASDGASGCDGRHQQRRD